MSKSRHHLAEVIAERSLKASNTKKLAQEVAAYLLHDGHTADLDSLVRDIMQYRADHGVVEVTAVSSHELDKTVVADIKRLLHDEYPHAKHVTINQHIDPRVVGGVRIDQANEQLDLTTRAKLNKFKRLTGAGKEY